MDPPSSSSNQNGFNSEEKGVISHGRKTLYESKIKESFKCEEKNGHLKNDRENQFESQHKHSSKLDKQQEESDQEIESIIHLGEEKVRWALECGIDKKEK